MKHTQTFVAAEWEDMGEMGFRPEKCSEAFNPLNYPPALAHDFVEHAGDFTVEGEIKAHAAMYFVRYEGGWFPSVYTYYPLTPEIIGQEWINLYEGILKEGCLFSCEKQSKLDDYIEKDLRTIISHGKRFLLSEIGGKYLDTDVYTQLSQNFADWFRKGYREAEQRYETIGRLGAINAYQSAMDFFENAFKHELLGGERVTLSLDLETGEIDSVIETECYGCGTYCDLDSGGLCEDCSGDDE